jgi:hypothetical protein
MANQNEQSSTIVLPSQSFAKETNIKILNQDPKSLMFESMYAMLLANTREEVYAAKNKVRNAYLNIFKLAEEQQDAPIWLKNQFMQAGDDILKELLQQAGEKEIQQHDELPILPTCESTIIPSDAVSSASSKPKKEETHALSIWCENQLYKFSNQHTIILGRMEESDIDYTDKMHQVASLRNKQCSKHELISRVHIVIFSFPELNKLYIIDMSFDGSITQLERNGNSKTKQSVNPRVCTLNFKESAKLEFGCGLIEIQVNPILCFRCKRELCSYKFKSCEHLASCDNCVRKMLVCPICNCRAPLIRAS